MLVHEAQVGMNVVFGRGYGEHTLGVIKKVNACKAKVETLEKRGRTERARAGQIWSVPYSMMRKATQAEIDAVKGSKATVPLPNPTQLVSEPIAYSPFDEDNLILEAIAACYSGLSPENLCCDGEASPAWVRQQSNRLQAKLQHLQAALGRMVSESDSIDWHLQKMEYERLKKSTGLSV